MINNNIPPITREYLDSIYAQSFQEYKESSKGLLDSFVYNNFGKINTFLELCIYLNSHNQDWYKIAISSTKHYIQMYQKLNWKRQQGFC